MDMNHNLPVHTEIQTENYQRSVESGETAPQKPKAVTKILSFIVTLSLVALFFGLPIFFTGATFQGLAFEKQIYFYFWILVALVSWVTKGVIEGELKIARTPLDIPIGIFWLIYLLATIFSVDRWHSFWGFFGDPSRGLASITALIIAYYLILSSFNLRRFKWMLGSLVASSALVTLWTILAFSGLKFLPESLLQVTPLSLVGSISGLAIFTAVVIPIIISVIFLLKSKEESSFKEKLLTILLIALIAVNLFILAAVYNYTPWPALLIGMGFFLIFILSRIVTPSEKWTWLPMAVFVLMLAIVMIFSSGTQWNLTRVNLPVEVSPSYALSWEVVKESVKDNFILGSGPATYGYDFSLHHPREFNLNPLYNLRFYQGSGLIAEFLPTMGILGIAALLLLIVTCLGVGVHLLTRDRERNKILSLGLASAGIILLVSAVTVRAEGFVLILGGLVGTLALAKLFDESERERKFINLSLKASPKFALTLAFIFMLVSAGVIYIFVQIGNIYRADLYAGSAAREAAISEEGSVAKMVDAVRLNNREGRYYSRLAQEYIVLVNNEAAKSEEERDLNKISDYLNLSIVAATRARDLMPQDVLSVEVLAQVYENASFYVAGSLSLAEEQYKRAQELEPENPNFDVRLGQVKLAVAATKEGEERNQLINEAKGLFESAIAKKSNLAEGHNQLALVEEALGNLDKAIDTMSRAVLLDQNNITYRFNLGRLYQARGNDEDNKIAEELFKSVLGVNDKEINTHFSLALLYEKTNRKSEAIDEYKTVLDLLPASPAGEPEGSEEVRKQVEEMISNIESGKSNLAGELIGEEQEDITVETEEVIGGEEGIIEEGTTEETGVIEEEIAEPAGIE